MTAYRTRGGTTAGQKMPSCTTLICDAPECRTTALQGDTAVRLRQAAGQMNWVRVEGRDYCPNHHCVHGYVPGDHHYESGTCGPDSANVNTSASVRLMAKPRMEVNISFRVSKELRDAATAKAEERQENVSDVLREALERYVRGKR